MENASTNSQALLDGVADGTIDYTIADSTEFALAHDVHPDLRIAFDFPGRPAARLGRKQPRSGLSHDMSGIFRATEASMANSPPS